jgi:ribosomal protein L7Ae-like RNA K-turn-binding protein
VHPRYRCVDAAVRSGALRRALGVDTADVSARQLSQSASEQYARRAEGLLLAGHRSRKLTLGTEAVRTALNAGQVHVLLIAKDAEGSREELTRAAERLGARCLVWSDKQELGRLFGRAMLSIVGVLDAGIATELRHVVRCAAELAEDA